MTKEELEKRIILINIEMGQLKDNYKKLEGHLAENQHWLDETIKNEKEILKCLVTTDDFEPNVE